MMKKKQCLEHYFIVGVLILTILFAKFTSTPKFSATKRSGIIIFPSIICAGTSNSTGKPLTIAVVLSIVNAIFMPFFLGVNGLVQCQITH